MSEDRTYPTRPFLAVSAAIIRDGKVVIVRRGAGVATGVYTLPGGVVEAGETVKEAVIREVWEEVGMTIEPLEPAGYREMIARDADGQVKRHFVILCFAARWIAGEPTPDLTEIVEAEWRLPAEVDGLKTTDGLREIIDRAMEQF
jgi:ADP-ribose pyrophosphatase YjhB (NUDIX family)